MWLSALGVVAAGKAPCDILLLFAASEGDAPKVIELLAAGAHMDVKVSQLATLHTTDVLQSLVRKERLHSNIVLQQGEGKGLLEKRMLSDNEMLFYRRMLLYNEMLLTRECSLETLSNHDLIAAACL